MKALAMLWATALVLTATPVTQSPEVRALPEAPGKPAFVKMCVDCHALALVTRMRANRAEWSKIIDKMAMNGAEGTDAEFEAALSYVSSQFGRPIRINTATAAELQAAFSLAPEAIDAIVKYRTERGKFASWDDLLKVPGVNAAALEEQRKNVSFESE